MQLVPCFADQNILCCTWCADVFLIGLADGAVNGFRYFWLTDSCPQTVQAIENHKPFEVLSLAEPIAAALQI
jgi:hypothetical protein